MCEDDLEKVEMPIDSMFPSAKNEASENGDIEDTPDAAPLADLDEEIQKKPLVRLKAKTPAKAKPSKTLLQFAKKKRKRSDSEGSDADLDRTPPPSPPDEESGIEKRRSGRNTKRKKYVDDVQYNFSDEEGKELKEGDKQAASAGAMEDILGPEGAVESTENSLGGADDALAGSGPNYAFIDPTAEDTMIVQFILASRMGTRELAEEEPQVKEEAKVEVAKENGVESAVKIDVPEEDKEDADKGEIKEQRNGDKADDNEAEKKDEMDQNASSDIAPNNDEKEDVKAEGLKEESDEKPGETTEEKKELDSQEVKGEPAPSDTPTKQIESPLKKPEKTSKTVEVEEFLVKFKNFSYLHCQWLTEEELLRGDKRVSQKVKRYQQKKEKSANMMDFCDDEPFNPDYVEVDRVLDSSVHTETDTNVSFLLLSLNT